MAEIELTLRPHDPGRLRSVDKRYLRHKRPLVKIDGRSCAHGARTRPSTGQCKTAAIAGAEPLFRAQSQGAVQADRPSRGGKGTAAANASWAGCGMPAIIAVSNTPGAIVTTRMPKRASSRA